MSPNYEDLQQPNGETPSRVGRTSRRKESSQDENRSDELSNDYEEANDSPEDYTNREIISQGEDRMDNDWEMSKDQVPPSYQISSGGSDYSPNDTDSDTSTASQADGETDSSRALARMDKTTRKRKLSTEGPEIQFGDDDVDSRHVKRAKASFSHAYLELLNEEIEHAASQYAPLTNGLYGERLPLPMSQIGMTIWTPMEKERFFEALGRLGRDDTTGIAQRIRTKGEMEVRQYMKLLQDGLVQRKQSGELPPLALVDFPAAAELSHECCQAVEEAADSIATRQDHSEMTAEEQKHGPGWLVSLDTYKDLIEEETEDDPLRAGNTFHIRTWLMLSERLFMNSPSEGGNWQSVGDRPSIRLTTLEDFGRLVLTLTRRLVATSLYMATSRLRADRGYRPDMKDFVRDKDVHAAAISLGLATQKPPLTESLRRLGLRVYYEEPPKRGEDEGREPMSYEDLEDALDRGGQQTVNRMRHQMERIGLSSDESSILSDSPLESEPEADSSDSGLSDGAESEEDEDVKAEADEVMLYSALDPPQTKRDRQTLFRKIKAEREQERYADAVDAKESYQEEKEMWELLGTQPLEPLADPGSPGGLRRLSAKHSVEAVHSVGKDWRAKTKVMSEWEARYQGHI